MQLSERVWRICTFNLGRVSCPIKVEGADFSTASRGLFIAHAFPTLIAHRVLVFTTLPPANAFHGNPLNMEPVMPNIDAVGGGNGEQVEALLDELFVVDVPDFKRGGRLRIILDICFHDSPSSRNREVVCKHSLQSSREDWADQGLVSTPDTVSKT